MRKNKRLSELASQDEGETDMPQHVIVTAYNPEWKEMFEAEALLIQDILGDNCVAVHHIGSTAVKGLKAKPIIDIMPVVKRLETIDNKRFEQIGYEALGEFGIPGRRYFRKGGQERTHQIHIFEQTNTREIERHLAVRDYLRCSKKAADAYGELKSKLAIQYPYDIEGYCDGKDEFVKSLEREALEWKNGLSRKMFHS